MPVLIQAGFQNSEAAAGYTRRWLAHPQPAAYEVNFYPGATKPFHLPVSNSLLLALGQTSVQPQTPAASRYALEEPTFSGNSSHGLREELDCCLRQMGLTGTMTDGPGQTRRKLRENAHFPVDF